MPVFFVQLMRLARRGTAKVTEPEATLREG